MEGTRKRDTMLPTVLPPKTLYRGDSGTLADLTFMIDDTTPEDLTEFTWEAQWRTKPDAPDSIALDVEIGVGGDTSRMIVRVSGEKTAQMSGNGIWDLQGTKHGEVRTRVMQKTILQRDVTR